MSPKNFGSARYKNRRLARQRWSRNAVAARHRIRIQRAISPLAPEPEFIDRTRPRPEWFRITVAHSDGSRVTLTSDRTPWGWSISPALMGRKIATAMRHYEPAHAPH